MPPAIKIRTDASDLSAQITNIETLLNAMQFGSGTATFGLMGNTSTQVSAAGVSPGATGSDYVLQVFSIPANTFDIAGRTVQITSQGSFAANTNSKRLKIIVGCTTAVVGSAVTGGTAIVDTGAQTTNANGGGWSLQGTVTKYGAAGSNTQLGTNNGGIVNTTHVGTSAPALLTMPENAPILIAVTGNAVTATTDILANWFEVTAMN